MLVAGGRSDLAANPTLNCLRTPVFSPPGPSSDAPAPLIATLRVSYPINRPINNRPTRQGLPRPPQGLPRPPQDHPRPPKAFWFGLLLIPGRTRATVPPLLHASCGFAFRSTLNRGNGPLRKPSFRIHDSGRFPQRAVEEPSQGVAMRICTE